MSFAALMILWMILVHVFQTTHLTESSVYLTLYRILFFFIPWFCFKAGMFEKTMPDKVCFEKNFKRLMIPYFVFTGIGCMIHPISLYFAHDPEILKHAILSLVKGLLVEGGTTANAPVWFLFSLFVAKMLYNKFHSRYFTLMIFLSLAIPTAMFYLGRSI